MVLFWYSSFSFLGTEWGFNVATIQKRCGTWRAIIRKKDPYTDETVTKTQGGFRTKPEAEAWAVKFEDSIKKGVHASITEAENTTLLEALERYEREITPLKKGAKQEKARIAAWKRDPLANRILSTIRGVDLAQWRDKRLAQVRPVNEGERAKPISSTTIRNDLAIISHLFKVATKEWGLESLSNPVDKIKVPVAGKARDRRLNHQPDKDGNNEKMRLLAACEASSCKWLAPIVKLALETAMRQGELLSLRWENVDLVKKVIRLEQTKNDHTRTDRTEGRDVPLSPTAAKVLQELASPEDAVTRLKTGAVFPLSQDLLNYHWVVARKTAKADDLHFHDLRHEATTRFFEKGLSVEKVRAITGHKTLAMLMRYTHLRAEDLAKELG